MGLNNTQMTDSFDLLREWAGDIKDKKPSPEITFSDDPIALSWASYQVWKKFPGRRWVDLREVEAHDHDREMASITRKYYRDRLTMQVLKGKRLTDFQNLLYGIVCGEQPILQDQIGVIMKIPYFYVEDVALDDLFSTTKALQHDERAFFVPETKEDVVMPRAYVFSSRKNNESHNWWWTDSQGHAVLWRASANNPLSSLVKGLYERGGPLRIRAVWSFKRPRGPQNSHGHWMISNVELS